MCRLLVPCAGSALAAFPCTAGWRSHPGAVWLVPGSRWRQSALLAVCWSLQVCELDPGSAWGRGAVASLEPRVKERQEKLQAEMLGKLKDLGNSLLGKFGLSLDNFKAEKDPATGGYSIKFQQ